MDPHPNRVARDAPKQHPLAARNRGGYQSEVIIVSTLFL